MRVFEAFAGYGSQSLSLAKLGVPAKVVGISEISANAIMAYGVLRHTKEEYQGDIPNKTEMRKELKNIGVSTGNLNEDKLKQLYIYNKLINNYGDISRLDPYVLPDMDYFTYSFPCQDISVAGKQEGLKGNKSSLLYECRKIIEVKKPRYLLMENVKNLVGTKFKPDFDAWREYLSTLGYSNYYKTLNAKDYGIPQSRERVFMISVLGEHTPYTFPEPVELKFKFQDALEPNVDDSYYRKPSSLLRFLNCSPGGYDRYKIFKRRVSKRDIAYCICTGQEQANSNHITDDYGRAMIEKKLIPDDIKVRSLTPRECFRLMGLTDAEIDKILSTGISKTGLYTLAGNSIVVDVLNAIHSRLFKRG